MGNLARIKRIKLSSVLAATLPMLAIISCLLIYSILGKLQLEPYYYNLEENKNYKEHPWNYMKGPYAKGVSVFSCTKFISQRYFNLKDGTQILDDSD